jgi:RNA polymerase sigma factor (sigma-70 family)
MGVIFYRPLRIIMKSTCHLTAIPQQNDKAGAFLTVLETHKRIIYKIANSYCKGENDRHDLEQEIILKLWKSFDRYNPEFKYSTWIYRIALNAAISFYRMEQTRTRIAAPLPETIFNVADPPLKPDPNAVLLQKFIAGLKPLDKAVIILYLEEKSHKEIAAIIGITETNVATKIGRIKNILKQKFALSKT